MDTTGLAAINLLYFYFISIIDNVKNSIPSSHWPNDAKSSQSSSGAPIERMELIKLLVQDLFTKFQRFETDLCKYQESVRNLGIEPCIPIKKVQEEYSALRREFDDNVGTAKERADNMREWTANQRTKFFTGVELLYRDYLYRIAALSNRLEWQTPAWTSSREPNFFLPEDLTSQRVGYKRMGHPKQDRYEQDYQREFMKYPYAEHLCCLTTGSGMGAYAVVENFLTRHHLKPGNILSYCMHSYLENRLQLESLSASGANIRSFEKHSTEAFKHEIERYEPKVIFIEPLTNEETISVVNIYEIIEHAASLNLQDEMFIVVDFTMTSGSELLFQNFDPSKNSRVHIIGIESLTKYKQYGMDHANAGIVIAEKEFFPDLYWQRARTGTFASDFQIENLPLPNRHIHDLRMSILQRNASVFSQKINQILASIDSPFSHCEYAGDPTHSAYNSTKEYEFLGSVIPMVCKPERRPTVEELRSVIQTIIIQTKHDDVSLNAGTSFGFSTTRVAAIVLDGDNRQYLRFSVGIEEPEEIMRITESIANVLRTLFK